ncbi:MAG: hypothetical protein KIT58_23930, partial [Planctomycetota bacterium]|nr:hypothetical protein [Planctomycetota bacterium]
MNRFDARAGVTLLLALVTFTRIGGVRAEDPTPGEVDAGADAPTGALDAPADRALDAPAPDEAAAPVDG